MLQFDFAGERLFQHRNFAKWKLEGNKHIVGFRLEKECFGFIEDLRERWVPALPPGTRRFRPEKAGAELRAVADGLCDGKWWYDRIGLDTREMVFLPDGTVGAGAAGCERTWTLRLVESSELKVERPRQVAGIEDAATNSQPSTLNYQLFIYGEQGLTLRARLEGDGVWRGAWVSFERGRVEFRRVGKRCGNGAKKGGGAASFVSEICTSPLKVKI